MYIFFYLHSTNKNTKFTVLGVYISCHLSFSLTLSYSLSPSLPLMFLSSSLSCCFFLVFGQYIERNGRLNVEPDILHYAGHSLDSISHQPLCESFCVTFDCTTSHLPPTFCLKPQAVTIGVIVRLGSFLKRNLADTSVALHCASAIAAL